MGERYKKQTFRNRYQIAGANRIETLTVPIHHPGNYAQMANIVIDNQQNWKTKHLRSLETAYRRSSFFEHYFPLIEPAFKTKHHLLAEFNLEVMHLVLKCIKMDTKLSLSNDALRSISYQPEQLGKAYYQVFLEKNGFLKNLSILDLLFNMGPSFSEVLE